MTLRGKASITNTTGLSDFEEGHGHMTIHETSAAYSWYLIRRCNVCQKLYRTDGYFKVHDCEARLYSTSLGGRPKTHK